METLLDRPTEQEGSSGNTTPTEEGGSDDGSEPEGRKRSFESAEGSHAAKAAKTAAASATSAIGFEFAANAAGTIIELRRRRLNGSTGSPPENAILAFVANIYVDNFESTPSRALIWWLHARARFCLVRSRCVESIASSFVVENPL